MKSELEIENLAQKHCENFMNECGSANIEEAKLASQKLTAIATELMKAIHEGRHELVQ